jgi:hypothetical protein
MKMRIIVFLGFLNFFNLSFGQGVNVYFLTTDSKGTKEDLETLMRFLYFDTDLKLNGFHISHYSTLSENDTLWVNKKKRATYHNFEWDCNFNLNEKLKAISEANKLSGVEVSKEHLLSSSETMKCLKDKKGYYLQEINVNSELAIRTKLSEIVNESGKENINIYILIDRMNGIKPIFKFESDTIVTDGKSELRFQANIPNSEIFFSNGIKSNTNESKVVMNFSQSGKIEAFFKDENGCESNKDEVLVLLNNECNCDEINDKPKIHYKHENFDRVNEPEDGVEVDWDYQFIPEQSGSLIYTLLVNKVCAEAFVLEIRNVNEIVKNKKAQLPLYTDTYDMRDVDSRGGDPLAKMHSEILVFNFDLNAKKDEITNVDNMYYISITPIVDGVPCPERSFKSKKIKFSKCK